MKKGLMMLLVLALLAPACALAGGEALLLELPQDAQRVEHIEFDDGDAIETYLLGGGGSVQLLRYTGFDMTLEELAGSEYPGMSELRVMEIGSVGGCPAAGLRFGWQEAGQDALDVTLVRVDAGEAALIFKAAFPQSMGVEQIEALLSGMLATMDVSADGEAAADETAEVG